MVSAETSLVAPSNDRYKVINWITCIAMVGFHAGAIAALVYFSWTAAALTAFFYWMCITPRTTAASGRTWGGSSSARAITTTPS